MNSSISILVRLVLVFVFIVVACLPGTGQAYTYPNKPPDEHFYVDGAGLIKPDEAKQIDQIASKLLNEIRVPVYVVTISSLVEFDAQGTSIEAYATALYNEWGIGYKDNNNGMLLLVSKGDRKARIELGADWGHEYDYQAKRVMDDLIITQFKRSQFSIGILDGIRGMDSMARGRDLPKPTAPWWFLPALVIGGVLLVLLIINLFRTGRSGWAWALIAFIGVMLFFLLRNAGSSGSSSGFGGGFSGGGGATGSW